MTLEWRVVNADPADRLDMVEARGGAYRVEGSFAQLRASFYPNGVYTPDGDALIGVYPNVYAAREACELHFRGVQ